MTMPIGTDLTASHIPAVWNVAFIPAPYRNLWDIVSPKWCRHVAAFAYVPATESWIAIEPAEDRTLAMGLPDDALDIWVDDLRRRGAIILRIAAEKGRANQHRFGPVWCSTMIARLIGVPGGAWRPLALYRNLRRRGAEPVFGTIANVQSKAATRRSGDQKAA